MARGILQAAYPGDRARLHPRDRRDECATRPAESLAEGRRAEPPEACCSYPEDDSATAHLGDRHWTNRSSHRWRRRCRPLLRARLQPEPNGDDRAVGSARDDDSRGDEAGGASSLHRPKPWGVDRGAGRNGDRGRTPRLGPPVSPGSSPARPPGVTDRVGRRVRLATRCRGLTIVQSRVGGDFSPGFEQLIDIPYLAEPTVDELRPARTVHGVRDRWPLLRTAQAHRQRSGLLQRRLIRGRRLAAAQEDVRGAVSRQVSRVTLRSTRSRCGRLDDAAPIRR